MESAPCRYVKLLMQEFNLKMDKGFILSVYDIFTSRMHKQREVINMHTYKFFQYSYMYFYDFDHYLWC